MSPSISTPEPSAAVTQVFSPNLSALILDAVTQPISAHESSPNSITTTSLYRQTSHLARPIRWSCNNCNRTWPLSAVHRCLHCSQKYSHCTATKPPITIFDADFWSLSFHQRIGIELYNTGFTEGWTAVDWANERQRLVRRRDRRLAKGEGDCSRDCEYPGHCLCKRRDAAQRQEDGIRQWQWRHNPPDMMDLDSDYEAVSEEDESVTMLGTHDRGSASTSSTG